MTTYFFSLGHQPIHLAPSRQSPILIAPPSPHFMSHGTDSFPKLQSKLTYIYLFFPFFFYVPRWDLPVTASSVNEMLLDSFKLEIQYYHLLVIKLTFLVEDTDGLAPHLPRKAGGERKGSRDFLLCLWLTGISALL